MVIEVVQEQTTLEEGSKVQCPNHPYRNSSPGGGICAFCLQEKLGNLVTSSHHPPPLIPRSHQTNQDQDPGIVFRRSKSLVAPKEGDLDVTSYRRGFWIWSFLYSSRNRKTLDRPFKDFGLASSSTSGDKKRDGNGGCPDEMTRKVSRSRSVRGLPGECTLRRVESHREGKVKPQPANNNDSIKERVSCGGIFNGFMMGSPPVSSSSSYWVAHPLSKSWGWAFASPMRAFGGRPKKDDDASSTKDGIPSLLTVSG